MAADRPATAGGRVTTHGWILGFDVGGTKTAVLAGTADAEVLDREAFPTGAEIGFDGAWRQMVDAGDRLIARHGGPIAIGVSIGGPLDAARGIVRSPPNLPGWDDIPIKDLLTERYGIPTYVEHDAKAGALAEWLFGAGRGRRNLVFLTFGTGLGAGLILDGRLYRGTADRAGEVGHTGMTRRGPSAFGKTGSWEALASGAGLPRLARYLRPEHPWPDDLDAGTLIRLARDGDAMAAAVIRRSATWLGRGIANLVDVLDPELVVLGSLAVRAGDLFLPTCRRVAAAESLTHHEHCAIVATELGDRIGDVAALSAAIYHGRLGPQPDAAGRQP